MWYIEYIYIQCSRSSFCNRTSNVLLQSFGQSFNVFQQVHNVSCFVCHHFISVIEFCGASLALVLQAGQYLFFAGQQTHLFDKVTSDTDRQAFELDGSLLFLLDFTGKVLRGIAHVLSFCPRLGDFILQCGALFG